MTTTTLLLPPPTDLCVVGRRPAPPRWTPAPVRIVSVSFTAQPLVGPAGPTDVRTRFQRSLRLRPA